MPKVKRKPKELEIDEAPPAETPRRGVIGMIFRPRLLLLAAALAGAILSAPLIMKSLPNLKDRAEYRVGAGDVFVTEPPAWVPRDFVQQVLERGQLTSSMSLLDDQLVEKIAGAFRAHPWVDEVVAVRKAKPARIDVELRYRTPTAVVQMKQGLYPVDAAAVLLPPGDFTAAEAAKFPLIANVASPPQGPAGAQWGDVGVQGAARLAKVLGPDWNQLQLTAISVPRQQNAHTTIDELIFELITTGGSRIVWGRAPETGSPGELSAEQKVNRLKDYLTRFGSFDQPHGPYEIDIRHWQDMSRRPLSSATK